MFSGAGSSTSVGRLMKTALLLFAVTVGLLLWVHDPASAQTLPTTFDTTLPAVTGSTFPVNAGGSIQTAINAAAGANPNLNHEVVVQAGTPFTGALTIPTRAAGTGWIIIRSSALASLPAAGTRVGPANALITFSLLTTVQPIRRNNARAKPAPKLLFTLKTKARAKQLRPDSRTGLGLQIHRAADKIDKSGG